MYHWNAIMRDGLIGSARQMRKSPTQAEKALWDALRRKGIGGTRFRRHRVIGPSISDFCCLEQQLVIDDDGAHHRGDDVVSYDQERTSFLESYGFRVLRFSNEVVMGELERVIGTIAAAGSFPPCAGERPG